jgi:hypothetical protein
MSALAELQQMAVAAARLRAVQAERAGQLRDVLAAAPRTGGD